MWDFVDSQIIDDFKRTDTRVTVAVLLVVLTMLAVPSIIFALAKKLRNAFIVIASGILKILQILILVLLGVDSSYINANNPDVMEKLL